MLEYRSMISRGADLYHGFLFFIIFFGMISFFTVEISPLTKDLYIVFLWVGVFFMILSQLNMIFKEDFVTGFLDDLFYSPISFYQFYGAKLIIFMIFWMLPIFIIFSLFNAHENFGTLAAYFLIYGAGSLSLLIIAFFFSALFLLASRSGLLAILIVLPLSLPSLIFSMGAMIKIERHLPFVFEFKVSVAILFLSFGLLSPLTHIMIRESLKNGK